MNSELQLNRSSMNMSSSTTNLSDMVDAHFNDGSMDAVQVAIPPPIDQQQHPAESSSQRHSLTNGGVESEQHTSLETASETSEIFLTTGPEQSFETNRVTMSRRQQHPVVSEPFMSGAATIEPSLLQARGAMDRRQNTASLDGARAEPTFSEEMQLDNCQEDTLSAYGDEKPLSMPAKVSESYEANVLHRSLSPAVSDNGDGDDRINGNTVDEIFGQEKGQLVVEMDDPSEDRTATPRPGDQSARPAAKFASATKALPTPASTLKAHPSPIMIPAALDQAVAGNSAESNPGKRHSMGAANSNVITGWLSSLGRLPSGPSCGPSQPPTPSLASNGPTATNPSVTDGNDEKRVERILEYLRSVEEDDRRSSISMPAPNLSSARFVHRH
jgi:hypothetical protein